MIKDMDERVYWLGFSSCPGIGPARFERLLSYFGSAQNAWNANLSDLNESGIGQAIVAQFEEFKKKNSPFDYEEKLRKAHVSFLTLADPDYPKHLKTIKRPPFVLYTKGNFDFNASENELAIAVVGTRKVTDYGKQVTEMLTRELVNAGCVIVSGLALGVDAKAHTETLANGGKTIAVLGCGVDCCYPRENSGIYNSILQQQGVIVSEYPLSSKPTLGSFPSRNRIIAGLSLGVLVTEGAEDSGSLITAHDAFANGRKVFAVPGPITSSVSRGPIRLIAKGAKMVTNAEDILEELDIDSSRGISVKHGLGKRIKRITGDNKEEQSIIDVLQNGHLSFDEIVKRTGFNSSQVGTLLSLMEMKGVLRNSQAGLFVLIKPLTI